MGAALRKDGGRRATARVAPTEDDNPSVSLRLTASSPFVACGDISLNEGIAPYTGEALRVVGTPPPTEDGLAQR